MARIGLSINDALYERLRDITDRHNASQSEVLCAAVSVLSEDQIHDMLVRYRKLRQLERQLRKEADLNLLQFLRGRTAEEMEQLIQTAKRTADE